MKKKRERLPHHSFDSSFAREFPIANKVPALLVIYNIQTGKYVYVNAAVRRLLGYSPLQLKREGYLFVASLVHPDDMPRIREQNAQALKVANTKPYPKTDEPVVTFEYRMRHKNGKYRWLHSDGTVYDRDEQGKVLHVLNVFVDITDRKEAELATHAAIHQFQYIADNASANLLYMDRNGTIVYANDVTYKRLGYSKAAFYKRKAWQFDIAYTKKEYQTLFDRAQKEYIAPLESTIKKKNGQTIMLETAMNGVMFEKTPYLFCMSHDISERKKLEQQKDEFVAIASHELKTPVTSIKAYTQVLHRRFAKAGNTYAAYMLSKLDTQVTRLTKLIGDLLDVSKVQAGKLALEKERFDINMVVKDIVEEMQRLTTQHTIQLDLSEKQRLYGDKERIGQVLTNLLSNAIKYSPDAKEIIVKTEKKYDAFLMYVQDFGVGIPKKHLSNVFDRFFRVGKWGKSNYPGLGLGLYISFEIIKRHGGSMWVESVEGKGSTFYVSLPLQKKRG